VVLYFGGGLTVPESLAWGGRRADTFLAPYLEMIVSLAGPAANIALAGLVLAGVLATGGSVRMTLLFGLLPFPWASLPYGGAFAAGAVWAFLWVNLFWATLNLMPVYPFNGGLLARRLRARLDPRDAQIRLALGRGRCARLHRCAGVVAQHVSGTAVRSAGLPELPGTPRLVGGVSAA
jgi:hypothetical protein